MKFFDSMKDILRVQDDALPIFGGNKFFDDFLKGSIKRAPLLIGVGNHTSNYASFLIARRPGFIKVSKTHRVVLS